jgi:dihydrolipoamide dehydrogenase
MWRSTRVTQTDGTIQIVRASNIILATGSSASIPPFIALDGHFTQTTDQALDMVDIPERIVIVGGGVIGIEMATIYLNLGSQVTIIEQLPDILTNEDKDVRADMRKLIAQRGATLHLGAKVKEITIEKGFPKVRFEDYSDTFHNQESDRVLVATGRAPQLNGINASKLGLAMNGSFVKINSRFSTNLTGIYAIGDLVGGMMLAHKASAEAEAVIDNILGNKKEISPLLIPRCIWGLAEIGSVGMNEEQALDTDRRIKIGRFSYSNSGASHAKGNTDGFSKIIGDADTGEILGVHIMGEHATDLISEAVTVMKMEGAVEDLYDAIKPHPTLSESVLEAAMDWNSLAIHTKKK